MQTIATFFTGIMLFFSGLFGTTPHQVVITPSMTESTSVQVIKTSTTTLVSIPKTSPTSGSAISKEETYLTFNSPFAEVRDSNVILLSAGPVATIQQDFGGYVVYTNNDSSKIQFVRKLKMDVI